MKRHFSRCCLLGLLINAMALQCFALDLEPRLWNHLPIGKNFAGLGYASNETDIFVDPVLLLEDVEMEMHSWIGKYIRTFELLGKSSRIDITQAYQEGKWKGLVNGVPASTSRSGWSDTFVRFAINLYGAPPLRGKEFAMYRSESNIETIVGMGLVVRLPTGEYMEDKLINLGQNRFAFRPQFGILHKRGKWTAELTAEMSFYTENDEFFNGNIREQEPLFITHAHLIHTFRPGLWIGAGVGYDYGGESSINGIDRNDTIQEIGWSFSFAFPINRQSGINVKYVGTQTQESTGQDTDTIIANLSLSW